MPPVKPLKRKDLIKALKKAGFEGPYAGGRHEFLINRELRLILPNPHQSEISKDLLARILRQANLTREEWEKLYSLNLHKTSQNKTKVSSHARTYSC